VDLDKFLGIKKEDEEEDEIISNNINVDTFYRVYIGDCEKVLGMMALNRIKVHLLVTSPPYFLMRGLMNYDSYKSYLNKMRNVFKAAKDVVYRGRIVAVNVGDYIVKGRKFFIGADFIKMLQSLGYTVLDDILWVKPFGYMNTAGKRAGVFVQKRLPLYYHPNDRYEHIIIAVNGERINRDVNYSDDIIKASIIDDYKYNKYIKKYTSDIWEFPPETNSWHRAPFPKTLPRNIIMLYSYVGETVLDPFMGSGTTLKVAAELKRSAIGIEIEKEYVERFGNEFKGGYNKNVEIINYGSEE